MNHLYKKLTADFRIFYINNDLQADCGMTNTVALHEMKINFVYSHLEIHWKSMTYKSSGDLVTL